MSSGAFTESTVESAALAWLEAVGWQVAHGADISPAGDTLTPALSQRDSCGEVILAQRLRDALARLNRALPAEALADAFRKLPLPDLPAGQAGGADLIQRHRVLYRLRLDGVTVEYVVPTPSPRPDGHPSPSGRGDEGEGLRRWGIVRVIDFDDPGANDWLAVNHFSVAENKRSRRPDVVLFVNGLPLAVNETVAQ